MKLTSRFIFIAFLLFVSSCKICRLSPEQFRDKQKETHGIILNVRTPAEYATSHIEWAVSMYVLATDFCEKIDSLEKEKVYFVYSSNGTGSRDAARAMKCRKFSRLYVLKGGMAAWTEKQFPVVK